MLPKVPPLWPCILLYGIMLSEMLTGTRKARLSMPYVAVRNCCVNLACIHLGHPDEQVLPAC